MIRVTVLSKLVIRARQLTGNVVVVVEIDIGKKGKGEE